MKRNLRTHVVTVHIIPQSSWAKEDIPHPILFRIMFGVEHFSDGEYDENYISTMAIVETSPIVQNRESLLISSRIPLAGREIIKKPIFHGTRVQIMVYCKPPIYTEG